MLCCVFDEVCLSIKIVCEIVYVNILYYIVYYIVYDIAYDIHIYNITYNIDAETHFFKHTTQHLPLKANMTLQICFESM